MTPSPTEKKQLRLRPVPSFVFASRWLQLPHYLGLIAAPGVYVFHFWIELATAIIGIGARHLLKTFISAANYDEKGADRPNHQSHHVFSVSHGQRVYRPLAIAFPN